jgi:hypothetical protein
MDRRSFVGGMLTALAGGPVAVAAGQTTLESGAPLTGDAAILAWAIRTHGEDVIAEEIAALLREPEGFTVRRLKTRLNRISRRRHIACRKAARRERHGGDQVLYRGPVHIDDSAWGQLVCRETRGKTNNNRRVEVGRTQADWAVFGIRNPMPTEYRPLLYRESRLELGFIAVACAIIPEPLAIPRGSRVLADTRNGRRRVMAAEVVRTADGACRLHLWSHSAQREEDGQPVPSLQLAGSNGGRVYETTPAPRAGLLAGMEVQP